MALDNFPSLFGLLLLTLERSSISLVGLLGQQCVMDHMTDHGINMFP